MSQQQTQAINRAGLDAAFEADEARKSNLILEAQLLREQSPADEAARKFAEAAQIEESLSQRCAALTTHREIFSPPFQRLEAGGRRQALFIRRLRSAMNSHLSRAARTSAPADSDIHQYAPHPTRSLV
jgi:hypothetical protein